MQDEDVYVVALSAVVGYRRLLTFAHCPACLPQRLHLHKMSMAITHAPDRRQGSSRGERKGAEAGRREIVREEGAGGSRRPKEGSGLSIRLRVDRRRASELVRLEGGQRTKGQRVHWQEGSAESATYAVGVCWAMSRVTTRPSGPISPASDDFKHGKGYAGKDEADERANDARDERRRPMPADRRRHRRSLRRRVHPLNQVAAPALRILAEVAPLAEVRHEKRREAAFERAEWERGLAKDRERQEVGAVGRRRRAVAEAELDREPTGRVLPELKGRDRGVVWDVVLRKSRRGQVEVETTGGQPVTDVSDAQHREYAHEGLVRRAQVEQLEAVCLVGDALEAVLRGGMRVQSVSLLGWPAQESKGQAAQ